MIHRLRNLRCRMGRHAGSFVTYDMQLHSLRWYCAQSDYCKGRFYAAFKAKHERMPSRRNRAL